MTIMGTEGPDNLTTDGSSDTEIDALGGDDTIRVDRTVTVHGGEGYDTLHITIRTPPGYNDLPDPNRLVSLNFSGFDGQATYNFGEVVTWDSIERLILDQILIPADVQTGSSDDILSVIVSIDSSISTDGGNDEVYLSYHKNRAPSVTLHLGEGNDLINGEPYHNGIITAYGEGGDDNLFGGWRADHLDGGEGDDVVNGNLGSDTLIGGGGNDYLIGNSGGPLGATVSMEGGTGDDIYELRLASTAIVELADEGTDTVKSFLAAYTLGSNLENLVASVNGTGNSLDNVIEGSMGANTLDGGAGADLLKGGNGDDIYHIDQVGDVVYESTGAAAGGTDTVVSPISYTLPGNVENLILTGTAPLVGTGNNLANSITGNAANNRIDGRGGADTMAGGLGDDTYFVDYTLDQVVEEGSAGHDVVYSTASFTLGANVENLVLTGTAPLSGTGNGSRNIILGNSGNNVLNGGGGNDVLMGGDGNDSYLVDNIADIVYESTGAAVGGTDIVYSSANYALPGNVENLTLTGSAVGATGNSLANIITGNAQNNVIDGKAGADTMIGGLGDDTYHVDYALDLVVENGSAGTDTVRTTLGSYTLGANVENLVLTGTGVQNGAGNGLANILVGNAQANGLSGLAGDDTLNGGAGNDTLAGGLGNDTLNGGAGMDGFLFNTVLGSTANFDSIIGFVVADDTILLDRSVFASAGPAGTLAASAFRVGTAALDPDDRIIYDPGSGNIFYDSDGSGAGDALPFAHVTPGLTLTNADFLIVP